MQHRATLSVLALCATVTAVPSQDARRTEPTTVQLVRDQWGIPHVFAQDDADAMFGLGFAAAQDRAFQMYYNLRIVQGRLAELCGDRRRSDGRGRAPGHDMRMRTFGYWRHAQQVASKLDADTRGLLEAYSAGVDAALQDPGVARSPLFDRYDLEPEPWTPAACLASFWHMAQFFQPDGMRELVNWRRRAARAAGAPAASVPPPDDAAAIVGPGDVDEEWIARVRSFAEQHGLAQNDDSDDDRGDGGGDDRGDGGRKFSHAWVVGGSKATGGAAVLVAAPQTRVTNPSLFWEFHVRGATFDARGVGVAGSPILLCGFNRRVAWGVTALGADQADLMRLETDPDDPTRYRFDGEWRRFGERTEQIAVRGRDARELVVRTTHFGPVVTRFAFARPGEPEVALLRVPLCDSDVDSVQAAFAMMRATDVDRFWSALRGWRFPTMNVVFGDADGAIGYSVAGAFPIRKGRAHAAGDGSSSSAGWQGFVPFDLLPHVLRPQRGVLFSANHRPIGSFYPVDVGQRTGALGDTLRSWRLRELLLDGGRDKGDKQELRPNDVFGFHQDAVNPARREVVRLGLHLRDVQREGLSDAAEQALEVLEPWYHDGARSDLGRAGAGLAEQIAPNFRRRATRLATVHGGGQAGLCRFLKELRTRHAADPKAPLDADERAWVDKVLATALQSARASWGDDPKAWADRAAKLPPLLYQQGLDRFGSLAPELNVASPALARLDEDTLGCQKTQAYTQLVRLDDVDLARSILPIGQSELAESAFWTSARDLWRIGRLHPAPLSREAVKRIEDSVRTLTR